MDSDSFYIVLPSNTPVPGNKTSDYLVKFPNIIDLSDGNWTVALSSIVYPLSFSGVEEEQRITIHYEDKEPFSILIPKRVQYNTIGELENILNETIITTLFNNVSKSRPKRERPVAQARDLSQRPVAQQRKAPIIRQKAQLREESPPIPTPKQIPTQIIGVTKALEPTPEILPPVKDIPSTPQTIAEPEPDISFQPDFKPARQQERKKTKPETLASTSPSKPDNSVRTTTKDNRPKAQIRKQALALHLFQSRIM